MRRKHMLAAGTVAALAIAGGGAAIAATGGDRTADSEAAVADAAEELGVTPAKLTDALQEALKNRVDAAVEAGRLTEARGQELKERIDAGEVPLLGIGPGHGHRGHGPGPGFDAAASYLGVTEAELRESLADGKTLAELSRAEGKSVDGLVGAMVAEAKERLSQAVEDGRLTQAQANERSAELEDRITAIVNGERPERPRGFGRGPFGPGADAEIDPPSEDAAA